MRSRCVLLVLFALWAVVSPSEALAVSEHPGVTEARPSRDPGEVPQRDSQSPEDEDEDDDDDGSDDPRVGRLLPPTVFRTRVPMVDRCLAPLLADPPETPPPRC